MAITSSRSIVNIKESRFQPDDARVEKYTLGDELPAELSQLHLRPRPMASEKPSYTIQVLGEKDADRVIEFLRRWFFRDEPMNQTVQLLETPESTCAELEEYSICSLDHGVSVAAVDQEGNIVGMVINGLVTRKEAEEYEDKIEECPNPKFRRVLRVLATLERESHVWRHLPDSCDKVMEVRVASVDSAWRGRSLMRVLCEESERIAIEKGASACRMDATSAFSAAAAERLGYRAIYRVPYKDLPDAPVPEPPHIECRVYIKLL